MRRNIAIVGCGKIFSKHFLSIKNQEKKGNLKLVAICDDNKKLINSLKIEGVAKYTKISDLLKNEEIDIVSILTPSGLHFENAMLFAGKVKTVIIEKPLALRLSDAKKMVAHFKKKKTQIFVVLQNRFNDPILKLKKAISKGLFGDLLMFTVRLRWSRDIKYYTQAKWRGTWKLDGGVVANQSAHFMDLLQWIFGMPDSVFSRIRQMHKIKSVEDTALAIFEYKKEKKIALIEATTAIRPKNLEGSISVIGSKGSAVIGGMSADKIISWSLNNKRDNDLNNVKNIKRYELSHNKFYNYVISVLNKKIKKNSLSGEEGIKSLKLINAVYSSSQKNTPVDLKDIKDTFLGNDIKGLL